MNGPHTLIGLATTVLLAFHAGAADAQVYKWVDERGQVNYSNQLPSDGKVAQKASVVKDRVSVYSPDPALLSMVERNRQRMDWAAMEKPEAWRPAVAAIGGPAPAPSLPDQSYETDYPYWVSGGGYWGYRPWRPLHKVPQFPGGKTGNNTVGLYNIIPGSSAPVPRAGSPVAPPPAPFRGVRPGHFPRDSQPRR